MVDFRPRNALNEKCSATFLVRNAMENTFRTRLRHLESIWSGSKFKTSANKSAMNYEILASFCDFYGFSMQTSNSDHPKINDRMHVQACFDCDTPIHTSGNPHRCSRVTKSGLKSHLLQSCKSHKIFLKLWFLEQF